jgi:hypothetical protein
MAFPGYALVRVDCADRVRICVIVSAGRTNSKGDNLAQPNFQYEKRQKELEKKRKKEEKTQQKLNKNQPQENPEQSPDEGGTNPPPAE